MNTTSTTAGQLGSQQFPHPTDIAVVTGNIPAPYTLTPQGGALLVEEVVPRIRSHSFIPLGAEDREEIAQDAIAIAAALLASAQARGKQVSPGNISYYAIRLIKNGRRSSGRSKTDVMHAATRRAGRSQVLSMDAVFTLTDEAPNDETMSMHDVLAAQSEDPAVAASRRLDWQRLSALLDPAAREVLGCLIEDKKLTTLVPKLRRGRSVLQQDKNRLARLVRKHLGADILSQVQARPGWMDTILAKRKKRECLYADRTPEL